MLFYFIAIVIRIKIDLNLNLIKFKMDYIQDFRNLEIPITTNKNEIKAAYKRLSKKYHPDKNKNQDYSKFIKISESYKRLMKIYEYKLETEDYEYYIENYIEIIKYLYDIIKEKLVENTKYWFYNNIEKTKDIIINLDVDLVDIYKCEVKKVKIKVLRNDKDKLFLKKEDFYISLFDYKKQYIFRNKADDDLIKENGDIIININIKNEDGYYLKNMKDEKFNLYYDMEVSLIEYLFGIKKILKILNMKDNIIELNIDTLYEDVEYIVNDKGLLYKENDNKYKNGKFIIKFKVCNKYLELNAKYKEDKNFKDLIKKYF